MGDALARCRQILRTLSRTPGFSLFVVLAFALGIGANTAVFSVADAFLFKPVPFPKADRLLMLHARAPGDTTLQSMVSAADYLDIKQRANSLESVAAFQTVDFNLSEHGDPETAYAGAVTSNFFDTLAVRPLLGRTFAAGEDEPGNNRVVVLSYGLWQRRFAADPAILQREIKLNGSAYTVIGVADREMRFPAGIVLWTPLTISAKDRSARDYRSLRVVARLKENVTMAQAGAEIDSIAARFARDYPETHRGWSAMVQPLRRYITGDFNSRYMPLLLAAVFFVLLIACTNVMSMQLARISGRRKEFALRVALGAGRRRIVSQVVAESVVLAIAGAAASLLFSAWGLEIILSRMPGEVARYIVQWDHIQLDWRALAFTLAIAIFAGIFSGVLPALRTTSDVNQALKDGGRSSTPGRAGRWLRSSLVVGEIAAAMVLLAGASLMVKGSRTLASVNTYLRPQSILTMQMVLTDEHYGKAQQRAAFYDRVRERLEQIPGVESAAIASNVPYGSNDVRVRYYVDGQHAGVEGGGASEQRFAQLQVVSANYLEMLGVKVMEGRGLSDRDGATAPRVAVVSQGFARRNWPQASAIGQRVRTEADGPWLTVVGVVQDVRYDPFVSEIAPAIYVPYPQSPQYYTFIAIRAKGDPLAVSAPARAAIAGLDIDRPVWEILPLDRVMTDKLVGLSYVSVMLSMLGGIAIVLAAAGIYGLMSHSVSERTQEIGIRVALGAERGGIFAMIARRGLMLTATGLAIGLAIAVPLARLSSNLILGVSSNDPATFGETALLLVAVAMAACYIPARRALQVDPIVALRNE
jgi:putative ABC transport system permease protein